MTNFNPNSPCTVGVEWRPARGSVGWLDSDNKAVGMILDAATNDDITEFWVMLKAILGVDGIAAVELYDLTANSGTVPQPSLVQSTYYPTSDLYLAPEPWIPGTADAATGHTLLRSDLYPAFEALDSTVLTPLLAANGQLYDNDEFVANFFGLGYDFAERFGSVIGSVDGRWITRVRSWALVAQYHGYDTPPGNTIRPYLMAGGRRYWGDSELVISTQGPVEVTFDWYVDPDTGLPWTAGAVERFDTASVDPTQYGLGWSAAPTNNPNNITTILQARMIVESAGTDPRLAIGTTGPTHIAVPGWHDMTLLDPATADPTIVTLTAGHRYLFNVRRTAGLAKIGLARLEQKDTVLPGPPTWTSSQPLLDVRSRRISSVETEGPRAYAAVLVRDSGGVSLDSQPYATASPLDGIDSYPDLNEYYNTSPVNTDLSVRQRFTAPANGDYVWLTILAAQISEAVDGPLTVRIRDAGTDVAVGGTWTVTGADLPDVPLHSWQIVGKHITGSPATLVASTQYYFDITSTATPAAGWLVQVLNSLQGAPPYGPPTGTAEATFGGSTDVAVIGDPPGDETLMDVVVSVATVPATPADFAATPVGQACCIDHILLTWTPSPDPGCSTFGSYEIQRRDTPTGVWTTIGSVSDQNVSGLADWESKRNQPADYRIRMIRADGAPSDWSATATATAAMAGCTGLMFTSNTAPELSVFYQDLNQDRTFEFPANYDQFDPFDGYTTVFGELVNRGTRLKAKLRVRAGQIPCLSDCDDPDGIGTDVFGPLRSIAGASLPYVCVLNESGDRWFANVRTPTGVWTQHGLERDGGFAAYLIDVEIIETTGTPSPVDAVAGS